MRASFTVVAALLVLPGLALAGPGHLRADVDGGVAPQGPQPHPSIVILGDAGFLAPGSGVRGGSGTAADPYVISGWAILPDRSAAVRLEGTRAHVVIEDVYVQGLGSTLGFADCVLPPARCDEGQGVALWDVSNVTVRNVRVMNAGTGVRVMGSSDVRLHDLSLGTGDPAYSGLAVGLNVEDSRDVIVVNATIARAGEAVFVGTSSRVTIADSRVLGAPSTVYLAESDNVTLARVSLLEAELGFLRARDVSVLESSFEGGEVALSQAAIPGEDDTLHGLRVCGTTFRNYHGFAAVLMTQGTGLVFEGNRFEDNHRHLSLNVEPGLRFERNLVTRGVANAAHLYSPGAQIHHNAFVDNGPEGVVAIMAGSNATHNWWGDASGPSGDGPGTGDRFANGTGDAPFSPWLTAMPDLSVGCGAPDLGGPQAHAPHAVGAALAVGVDVQADVRAGPLHAVAHLQAGRTEAVGPVVLP